ncbi:hypothetical protein [Variovorax sp. YR216]|uniref:hypothetical protein n=1 Tax=Variovorax sp. YR216 TaxID=1882828 RepID=UPI00089531B3|nr:hypothetical protein [Variovorax sp. YR216]SEA36544.1 hypothetical protein SAMN05444680_102129 [Variovorax sp. YR216]
MKNKTLAAWLAFLGGPLGLHCFYLRGLSSTLGWLLPIPTALGLYGIERARTYGLDDGLSWVLIPLLGFTVSGCALTAIVYGLMTPEKWNARYNAGAASDAESTAGSSSWLTIGAIVLALVVGSTVLMASLAFSFQHYFEHEIEAGRRISQ